MDIVGQRVVKKKVWELTHPSTIFMCPLPVNYKPKRGIKKSKKGKETDVHDDPSQWEYTEGSHGSQATKGLCTKLTKSQTSSQSLRHLYLSQFIIFLHQYIDDIVDVGWKGGGGSRWKLYFRVIATLLG